MRWVPIVSIMGWRKAYSRLGLRVGGCSHISLLTHYENIIPRDSSTKELCNRRKKKMSTREFELLNAIQNMNTANKYL